MPLMKDWRTLATAQGLDIPSEELERVAPVLEALEAAFRPLVKSIPIDIEPAVTFSCPREESQ